MPNEKLTSKTPVFFKIPPKGRSARGSFRSHTIVHLAILSLFALSSACVSIDIDPNKGEPASGYTVKEPESPFEESKSDGPLTSWINKKNGNTISIYSICNDEDLPLKVLEKESFDSLENAKRVESAEILYNKRKALLSTLEGTVDGVDVKMKMLLLKKNECFYNLGYIGVKKTFNDDLESYNYFIKGFKAP